MPFACRATITGITLTTLTLLLLLPASSLAAVGRTLGNGDVSASGEGTYSIPIAVPAGINGLTPQLALGYGHRQDEGLAGIGWGISGLSEISRCGKTFAQDGVSSTVQLTTADRFCMDGVQLRLTSGTYGLANSQYRTEVDTISRYTAKSTAGNGPAWFEVYHKDGLIYEYGNSTNSRIESIAAGFTTTAMTWALSKIKDRSGNEVVFTYIEDGAPYGDHRISTITYRRNPGQGVTSGYTIRFVYETQPAGDIDTIQAAGGTRQDIKRLDRIDVEYDVANPDELIRRYEIAYEGTVSTAGNSRLASVQECAGSPLDCFAATSFTYQNGTDTNPFAAEISSGSAVPSGVGVVRLDINGDGRTDIAYSSSTGTGTWLYRLANSSGGYDPAVSSGVANTNFAEATPIDYDSDGLDDILVPYSGTTWHVIFGTASGLSTSMPYNTGAPDLSTAGNAGALDMNGDGREDLVWREVNRLKVRYRLASGDFETTVYDLSLIGPALSEPLFGGTFFHQGRDNYFDVNGDGLADVLITNNNPLTSYTLVIFGGGLGTQIAHPAKTTGNLPIDINGDGYTDIVFTSPASSVYLANTIYSRLSTGKSFAPLITGQSLTNFTFALAVALDWNGDGMQDMLIPNTSTGTWYYFKSNGTAFNTAVNTGILTAGATDIQASDIDGDGLDDISYRRSDLAFAYRPHDGVIPDLLLTATDGYGNSITYNYETLVQGPYTKTTGAIFPEQEFIGPLSVVTSAVETTGIGSQTYTKTFTYEGARWNLKGRGLSPFLTRTMTDSRNGLILTDVRLREFPMRGRPSAQLLQQSNLTKIKQTDFTWSEVLGGSGFQSYTYPYISQSVEKNYDVGDAFDGMQYSEVTTDIDVNSYGTPTSITTTTSEMSTGNGLQSGAIYEEQLINSSIIDDTITWCLGKPGQIQRINSHLQAYGGQTIRTLTQAWDTATYCRLNSEITEPASSTYKVTRTLGYDSFGNINSEEITGIGMTPRISTTYWGTNGQFPVTSTNPLGQVSSLTWDAKLGTLLSTTDPNGLTTSSLYDLFARKTRDTNVDGTYTEYSYTECNVANSYCATAYDKVRTKVRATAKSTAGVDIRFDDVFLDKRDRSVQTETQVIGGGLSRIRTIYDSLGRVAQRSLPDFASTPSHYITNVYDVIGRVTDVSRPTDVGNPTIQHTTVSYEGLTVTTTDPEGKISKKVSDAMGRVFRSEDHDDYYQQFYYDAFGSTRQVVDNTAVSLLQEATYVYGLEAFKVTSNDVDLGAWSYSYNALGEVIGHTDAKLQSFSATYDLLSRPLTRTEPDNTTTWTWGTSAAAKNIGALSSVSSTGHSESFGYDSLGRLSLRTITADTTYNINFEYDSTSGQLDSLTYPISTSGYRLKLKYGYQYGILSSVTDFNAPTATFWQAGAADARGNIIAETLGNGVNALATIRGFDPITGLPDYIQSGVGGGSALQNLEFSWNKVGNLTERKDLKRSLTENVVYDNLHRLDYSTLNTVQNLNLGYDLMGNITSKSDVPGTWTYHATKKHAVAAAGTNMFLYDANGNQIKRNNDDIEYTSYNYPKHVENGIQYHDYFYDAGRQRWKQTYNDGTSTETTIFVGGILEKRSEGSYTEYRHYISVGNETIALLSRSNAPSSDTRYFLRDHLGSVAEIINSDGSVRVSESFAAFGQRRDPTDWSGPVSGADEAIITNTTPRGFTFHTNLESSTLIHMNGRMADSLTGRFLSPDPYIPHVGSTQSFNRYSYVRNNSLSATDPSGFIDWFDWEFHFYYGYCMSWCFDPFYGYGGGGIHDRRGSGLRQQNKTPKLKSSPECGTGAAVGNCYGKSMNSRSYDVMSDVVGEPPIVSANHTDDSEKPIGPFWNAFEVFKEIEDLLSNRQLKEICQHTCDREYKEAFEKSRDYYIETSSEVCDLAGDTQDLLNCEFGFAVAHTTEIAYVLPRRYEACVATCDEEFEERERLDRIEADKVQEERNPGDLLPHN